MTAKKQREYTYIQKIVIINIFFISVHLFKRKGKQREILIVTQNCTNCTVVTSTICLNLEYSEPENY